MGFSYFSATVNLTNFVFEGLNIRNVGGLLGVCAVIFVVTLAFEGLKLLQMFVELRQKQNPLTYGRLESSLNDRSVLLTSLAIPADLKEIRHTKIKFHVYGFLGHTLNATVGYILMLAVMSYSVWVMVAVLLGAGLGYLIFNHVGRGILMKFLALTQVRNQGTEDVDAVPSGDEQQLTGLEQVYM